MNANPFTIRWTYRTALLLARARRVRFAARMANDRDFWRVNHSDYRLQCWVASIVGQSGLPEMLVCLSSFLAHAGTPQRFLIVSDGTLGREDAGALRALSSCVQVVDFFEQVRGKVPQMIQGHLGANVLMKKLAVLLSLEPQRRWLFTDPDVLYFPGAATLRRDLEGCGERPACLQDVEFCGDPRLVNPGERCPAFNSGVLFLPRALDWSDALVQFAHRGLPPVWLSEQTVVHLAMRANDAAILSPGRYVLSLEDQWLFADRFAARARVVCRHYVGTIRHKFWLAQQYPSKTTANSDGWLGLVKQSSTAENRGIA